ncbi:GNAT family N-acetyltransferase [Flavivirga aquimarina]|uniref:GNAT family N-acetyltransferase n=1 Tax=Flavivirga aquimarina TaxID=2027862 RepID=A0ABT8WBH0_9FLAO|nr:GNAT family N-acetyltransferase [Flavivirga aquimarina]MDO5970389.1 GNAT family N-acetyltransferase [Flavivirga aquimarina]
MIRKGIRSDVKNIIEITKSCAKNMIVQNIYQWNAYYPNKEAFLKDISRDELYVLEIENTLVGCITISTLMDKEYIPISWLTENVNNIYIHRLAIHPTHQGKGYAQELMSFAETLARNNKSISIRLDTFSQNKRNQKFYEQRGYKRLGNIYFPKQSEHSFYCYELVL